MQAFQNFLKQFPNYSPEVYDRVLPHLTTKHLEEGDYLLSHGKVCRNIAFIEKGIMRLFYLRDGKEVTNCFCKENTITTSYSSLIAKKESDIAIQALEPVKLILLPYEAILKLYDQDPFWQQLGRLAAENEYVISEGHNRFLRDLSATDRYLQLLENDKDLLQRVSLKHIATYLQISTETLSRIRNKTART